MLAIHPLSDGDRLVETAAGWWGVITSTGLLMFDCTTAARRPWPEPDGFPIPGDA